MLTRRRLLATTATLAALAVLARSPFTPVAYAQSAEDGAVAFVRQTSAQLITIVDGDQPVPAKQAALQAIVDRDVDVSEIARFCLGRFWRTATPQQQTDYEKLFHRVLMLNITSKVSDYKGVKVDIGRAAPREGDVAVSSTVQRPGEAPTKVEWLISSSTGSPKVVDVIAEGTSLRLTQRSDYASYLSHNGNSVQALIDAMRRQASA